MSSESPFAIGDYVKRTKGCYKNIKIGDVVIIRSFTNSGPVPGIHVIGHTGIYDSSAFEPATELDFIVYNIRKEYGKQV